MEHFRVWERGGVLSVPECLGHSVAGSVVDGGAGVDAVVHGGVAAVSGDGDGEPVYGGPLDGGAPVPVMVGGPVGSVPPHHVPASE